MTQTELSFAGKPESSGKVEVDTVHRFRIHSGGLNKKNISYKVQYALCKKAKSKSLGDKSRGVFENLNKRMGNNEEQEKESDVVSAYRHC